MRVLLFILFLASSCFGIYVEQTIPSDLYVDTVHLRTLELTATNIFEDINFNVSALSPGGSGAALKVDSGSNTVKQLSLEIDDGEYVYVNAQMSHMWVAGSTIYPHFHWQPQTDNAITNIWITTYEISDIDDDFTAQAQVTSTNIVAAGKQWSHQISNVPVGGIPMTGFEGPSTVVRIRYELDSTSEADIDLLGFDIHYRWRGSPIEYNP